MKRLQTIQFLKIDGRELVGMNLLVKHFTNAC